MKSFGKIILLLSLGLRVFGQKAAVEEDYYQLRSVPIPEHIFLEVGGIAPMPDGRIAVSTRRGEIWLVSNAYMPDGSKPHFEKFASGMHELLGLAYKDGAFYCTQRGELTKVTDTDRDGQADLYETITRFDLSGNYHEYAYGPVFDKDQNMLVTLNVAWIGYGEGLAKWHGWLLKIKPDGAMEPIATGLRSPAGFFVNTAGDIFYAENQGDWVGSGRVTHLEKGDFAGNAGGLTSTNDPASPVKLTRKDLDKVDNGQPMFEAKKLIPELKLPTVWFPHTLMGISTSDIQEDTTSGAFGPFSGHYFVADQGHSKVMRMTLEKVSGQYQGAAYPFREGWASGLLRLRWGQEGALWGGMTSRGWASTGKANFALQRLNWTGRIPFEMKEVKATSDGFSITFTLPVDKKEIAKAVNYTLNSFTYKYHHIYGSPAINQKSLALKAILVSEDQKTIQLVVDSLRAGYIHEIRLENISAADGTPLLHDYAFYTLNNIPEGPKTNIEASVLEAPMQHAHHMPEKTSSPIQTEKRINTQPKAWSTIDATLTLGTKPGLKYDKASLKVKAGSRVKLVFNNNDDMQHNVVITEPNKAEEVGMAALDLGLKGPDMAYVPDSKAVLYHTALLEPGSSETIYFNAPATPGTYQFVCTYPGHFAAMQGTLVVVK